MRVGVEVRKGPSGPGTPGPVSVFTYVTVMVVSMLLACVQMTSANSLGLNVPICDAYDVAIWKPLDQGGVFMWWTAAPKHTTDFTLRTGDGISDEGHSQASYKPGQLVYIHIRAHKKGHKYRGLLLYAKNAKGQKVGSWQLPVEDKVMFHTPPGFCGADAYRTVMHSGADEKNYHNVFPFVAPAAGTGKITFEALVKIGPANTGYFAWPNTAPLSLEESKPATSQLWFKGAPGESCEQTCSKLGRACFEEGLSSVTRPTSLQSAIGKKYACKQPLLKGCSQSDPSESVNDGFCYYQGCASTKATCSSQDRSGTRFCPCQGSKMTAIEDPGDDWDEGSEDA